MSFLDFFKSNERKVFLNGSIDDKVSCDLITRLLALTEKNDNSEIKFYINSTGGQIAAAFAIYDTIKFLKCDISTIIIGEAGGIASLLACAGTAGKRYAYKNSNVCLNEFTANTTTMTKDREIMVEKIKEKTISLFCDYTNQSRDFIFEMMSKSVILDAEMALKYGFIDKIISK